MGSFAVSKDQMKRVTQLSDRDRELRKRLHRLGIYEKDIKESFVHSSGPGGQNVNKVATCVVLKHIPSGVQVKSQKGRTQGINRYYARCSLLRKIEQKLAEQQLREQQLREKLRRQKRKRSRRSKENILEAKHRNSEKKSSRQKINMNKLDKY